MPYLSRRTVRGLLARSRASPSSPASSRAASTSAPPAKSETSPLPSSASAPVRLPDRPSGQTSRHSHSSTSSTSSTRAVTADEEGRGSPVSTRSVAPAAPAADHDAGLAAAPPPPQESRTREDAPPPGAARRETAAYLEAGIPIAGTAVAATPPVFAPFVSGHVAATDSPPYEFNGLFAAPASNHPPATPGAPPLYQPRAFEGEAFPQLPFTPFHRNAMAARSGEQIEHELPGDDRFPCYPGSRVVNGSWLGGRFERFTVGGRTFFCPVQLLLQYPHWQLLLSLEQPPQGWVLSSSTVDASIFALVIEALISPAGFDGTEPGLSLVKLALAARQAHDWGMEREVGKLVASFRRYVARRVFYRNPHRPDAQGVMDHHYFVHRSEDIFRAWRVLTTCSPSPSAASSSSFSGARVERDVGGDSGFTCLQRRLPPAELVCLYALAVPRDLWPALTAEFPDEFAAQIDRAARLRVVPEAVDYHDWWLRFFRLAGCLDFDWMADVPDVLNMFFRSHEEAAGVSAQQEERLAQTTTATATATADGEERNMADAGGGE
ncbi:hypothetical protein IF1G_07516 [Cordyceps javanica]|uniref:Uncharacterized protein n=1 Tax=Cordyceps javanica TaxID=43265 RepID=A0A545UWE2_9HYPO|nr:hypothetical protein IF1G_07516 [Cordyceps javanica]